MKHLQFDHFVVILKDDKMLEYVGFKDLKQGLVVHILGRTKHNLFKGMFFNNKFRQTRVRSYATIFCYCFHFFL